MAIKLIVGLRNPGDRYAKTRHNVGAWLLDAFVSNYPHTWTLKKDLLAELSELSFINHKVFALLPTTYMNLSGQSVAAVARYYRLQPEEILVIHDDLDLSVGAIRLKRGGGHGGHNGLQDIIRHLSSADFYRFRIGIGHPGDKNQVANYVLSPPSLQEKKVLDEIILQALPYFPKIIAGEMEAVMNALHRR
jgi:PTH1 family peptidyl-tRNA hydrolase